MHTSHLDYCNSLLIGLPNDMLRKLQAVLNASARLISNTSSSPFISPPAINNDTSQSLSLIGFLVLYIETILLSVYIADIPLK